MGILTLLPEHNSWAQLCHFLALIVHAATEHTGGMLCVGNSYCFEDDLMQGHPHDTLLQCPIHFHLTQAVEKEVLLLTCKEAFLHNSICFPTELALLCNCHNCTKVERHFLQVVVHFHQVVVHCPQVVVHLHQVVVHCPQQKVHSKSKICSIKKGRQKG